VLVVLGVGTAISLRAGLPARSQAS
jgi:hypothetical protein